MLPCIRERQKVHFRKILRLILLIPLSKNFNIELGKQELNLRWTEHGSNALFENQGGD